MSLFERGFFIERIRGCLDEQDESTEADFDGAIEQAGCGHRRHLSRKSLASWWHIPP